MVEKLSSSTENFWNYKNELNELKNSVNNISKKFSGNNKSREIENDLSDKEYIKECEKVLLDNWINVNDFSEEKLEQSLNDYRNYLSESHPDHAWWWMLAVMGARFMALTYLYKIKDKTWETLANKKNTYPWIFSIQTTLDELWYKIPREDWFFWPQTKEAIKKFQADNKIKVDWVPGEKTIKKIIARMIKQIKENEKND